jgi:hypothetical protein
MGSRTVSTVLASLALVAAPLAAQDTTTAPKDTVAVVRPVAPPPKAAQPAPTPQPAVVAQPAVAAPPAVVAQPARDTSPGNAVRPGMSEADVRARWGEPLAVRSANGWTYMFYDNAQERRVGYEDVVFLEHGQVVDAIVRSPEHVYAGVSSSPEGRVPAFTPPRGQPSDSAKGAAVTGVQVKPGQ